MQIDITGHHVDLTDSMQEYVHTKFNKLERFCDHINTAHVVLRIEKVQQIAEATLQINNGDIHATAESDSMYTSIDALIDKLVRQLNKHKEKLSSH